MQSRHNKRAKNSGQASGGPNRKPARSDSKPPRVLTEDEADILYAEKHKQEPGIPLRKALKELGIDESEVGV
ncbi:MAG: hypothetical protein WD733_13070 [Bryobacterales bacterium]